MRSPIRRDLAVTALVLLLALTEAAQVYLGLTLLDADVSWSYALRATFPSWVVLLALVLPLLTVLDRVERPVGGWGMAALGVTAVAFTGLHLAGTALAAEWMGVHRVGFRAHFYRLTSVYFVLDLFFFVAVVALHDAVRRYRTERMREVQAASVRADRAQARLLALTGQLRPDFFFNTLNAIAGLVARGEGERSVDALSSLSALLRVCLTVEPGRAVTLDDEMDLVAGYLSIQKARFPNRVSARWTTGRGAGRCAAPALLLVQLVELLVDAGLQAGVPFEVEVVTEEREGRLFLALGHSGPVPDAEAVDRFAHRVRRFDPSGTLVVGDGTVEVALAARRMSGASPGFLMELGVAP